MKDIYLAIHIMYGHIRIVLSHKISSYMSYINCISEMYCCYSSVLFRMPCVCQLVVQGISRAIWLRAGDVNSFETKFGKPFQEWSNAVLLGAFKRPRSEALLITSGLLWKAPITAQVLRTMPKKWMPNKM